MTCVFEKLDLTFVVAHFDHCLRGEESDADAEFVKNLAADLGLDFVVEKGSVDRNGNLEQNARSARYDFLSRTVEEPARALLTGHTLNDQAETFLINLIRGAVLMVLAMSPIREMPLKNTDGSLAKRTILSGHY